MANQLTRYATVATVDTADQGYFFGYLVFDAGTKANASLADSNNRVWTYQFVLPFRAIVRKIVFELITGVDASDSSFGLYNFDGTSLLVHTGAVSTDIADQGIIETAVTAVTLEPGIYVFVQTSSSISVQAKVWNIGNQAYAMMNAGATRPFVGFAANASSSGALPATLGTITASTARNPSIVGFLP